MGAFVWIALRAKRMSILFLCLWFSAIEVASSASAQSWTSRNYCPPGSRQVPFGGSYTCVCPDGTYATYGVPCSQRQGGLVWCSSTSYCQPGQTCCGSRCCGPDFYCSRYGCTPHGAVDCGNGFCNPGHSCVPIAGEMKCLTKKDALAYRLSEWFREKVRHAADRIDERHEKGMEYMLDNKEFKDAVRNIELLSAAYGVGGKPAFTAADLTLKIKDSFE